MNLHGRRGLTSFFFLHLGIYLALNMHSSRADAFWIANLNISFRLGNQTVWEITENGVFAKASPLKKVSGVVVPPEEPHQNACSSVTHFNKPVNADSWIALIMRGHCSFTRKISVAVAKGAVGVIIYNYPGTGNNVFPMFNFGAEDTVAVMIGNLKGMDLLHLIQNGIQVMVTIEVGKHYYPWLTHYMGTIFVFASVAVAYFTFYCAARLRRSRDPTERCQQILDINKAMKHLELRTLTESDKEVGSNGESCAVCLEMYKPKDVARVLHCRHLFHKTCVDPWLLKHQTCPVCKWDMLGTVESVTTEAEPLGTPAANETPSIISSANEEDRQEAHAGMQKGTKAQPGSK
ncbi:RING finger protein 148-like [Varanus komodoensis]|uniref:RING finger protein 148-like n=1 Tax=Varanus komodoensis TaxID=61221 RepID=UPI001CF7E220|nr:RING finger protein 148-like [Varanus komodoensis]